MSCTTCTEELGHLESSPLVVGEPNGQPSTRYRLEAPLFGRDRKTHVWATGDGLDPFITSGWLVPDGV